MKYYFLEYNFMRNVFKMMYQITYLRICRDAPTRRGLEDSLQASINFLRINRHSRNVEKNG